jgi:hypothetical protein
MFLSRCRTEVSPAAKVAFVRSAGLTPRATGGHLAIRSIAAIAVDHPSVAPPALDGLDGLMADGGRHSSATLAIFTSR